MVVGLAIVKWPLLPRAHELPPNEGVTLATIPWPPSGVPSDNHPMPPTPIQITPYNKIWPDRFAQLAALLRETLGDVALRVDHIGSTAVPGLAAKPVIDIQISVTALEPVDPFRIPLAELGYVYRADNLERTKRYFREPPGALRTHIHVRKLGSFSQQFPLLLRDYLRAHPDELPPYEQLKRRLAAEHPHDAAAYTEAKVPWFWQTIRRADAWAQGVGWEVDVSDA